MTGYEDRRKHFRFGCEAVVVILRETALMPSSVLMKNFSVGGLFFEVSGPLDPGEYIRVKANKIPAIAPIGSSSDDSRQAEVKWCAKKEASGSRLYGCGVQYV